MTPDQTDIDNYRQTAQRLQAILGRSDAGVLVSAEVLLALLDHWEDNHFISKEDHDAEVEAAYDQGYEEAALDFERAGDEEAA